MPDTNEQRSWEMHKCVGCERIFSGPHVLGHMTPAGDRCRSQATERITVYEQPEARATDKEQVEAALRTIRGPASDEDAFIGEYREAGGGYEGLQAVARAALEADDGR